jgi:hypothetical protein
MKHDHPYKAVGAGVLGIGVTSRSLLGGSERSADATLVPNQALVFGYDYNPGVPFRIVNLLQQGTVGAILGREVNNRTIVSNTDDYNGYVVRYQPDSNASEYAFVFVREDTLTPNQVYRFGTRATFFNSATNLITADISPDDAETTTPADETTTPADETTTPADETTTAREDETTRTEETTTADVVVNATTTNGR